jgi:outer membrane protein OmpA-like peptidoglycan-associated protein
MSTRRRACDRVADAALSSSIHSNVRIARMPDVAVSLWPWFAAALGVGVATGGFVGQGPRRRPARWLVWFLATAAVGALALRLGALEGAAAPVVAVGIGCFLAFVVGAAVTAAARGALGGHERWAIGLAPLALLWWGAVQLGAPVEQKQSAAPPPPPPAQLAAPAPSAPPPVTNADQTGAIPAPPVPASAPSAVPAALPAGELDAAACQGALDQLASVEPVRFNPTHATIHRRASQALDKAVEVIRRCPQAGVDIIGFDDGAGADAALALRRARAAERYLQAVGVGGRRLGARAADAQTARPRDGVIGYALRRVQ